MKRVLILVFAVIMILSLAACGNKNDQNTTDVDDVNVTVSPDNDMADNNDMTDNNGTDDMAHDDVVDTSTFTGSVSMVDGRTIIVKPDDGEDIRSSGDKVSVSLGRDHNFVVGDKVRVTFDGKVMESDPVIVNATNIEEID